MHSGKQITDPSIEALIGLLEAPPILAKLEARETDALSSLTVIENDYAADATIIEQGARVRSIHSQFRMSQTFSIFNDPANVCYANA